MIHGYLLNCRHLTTRDVVDQPSGHVLLEDVDLHSGNFSSLFSPSLISLSLSLFTLSLSFSLSLLSSSLSFSLLYTSCTLTFSLVSRTVHIGFLHWFEDCTYTAKHMQQNVTNCFFHAVNTHSLLSGDSVLFTLAFNPVKPWFRQEASFFSYWVYNDTYTYVCRCVLFLLNCCENRLTWRTASHSAICH